MPVPSPSFSSRQRRRPTAAALVRVGPFLIALAITTVLAAAAADAPRAEAALAAHATTQQGAPFAWHWLEGEDATRHEFNGHNWYCCDGVRADLLSPGEPEVRDGEWLAHYANDGRGVTAEWNFTLDQHAPYTVWVRASSWNTRLWWDVNGTDRIEHDMSADPREYLNLLEPGRIDIRFLAWQKVGGTALGGRNTLRIGIEGHPSRNNGQEVHGGIDAIVLVEQGAPWAPSGMLRPPSGAEPAPGADDWFPLIPSDDPFSSESVTDASRLLHTPAGRHGPLRRDGRALHFADGTPAVFWGVNAHPPATEALAERQARWLAKQGVNLVRLHPVQSVVGLLERDPRTGERRLNPQHLDELDRWFAVLKRHGIYMAWSPVYPHIITPDDGYSAGLFNELQDANTWNMPPGTTGKSSSGVVNFMRPLQDAEWAWLRPLLEHVNPYTELRYVDDPALAFLETHNEDSIFWHWPLNSLQGGELPGHLAELQSMWATWLRGRYANDAALRAAWGPVGSGSRAGDSLRNEAMPIYGAWEFAADGPPQHPQEQARLGDWVRFLAETQRDYFARRETEVRDTGYRGVTITTAWMSGGPGAHLANLWTDDAAEAIDRHSYFGGGEGGHNVRPGTVNNGTHLARPGSGILMRGLEQLEDKPFVMTEWTQSPPNQWKAEIAPLFAFYGMGLHGWDASMHFSADQDGRMGGGWPNENSYVSETPHYAGQFPALARSIHRGDFQEGPLAAARRLATDDIFRGVDALTRSTPSGGWAGQGPGGALDTPAEVFAIGRTTIAIGEGLERSERLDWDRYWDADAQAVRSATDELVWDYGQRVVQARSPRSQGLVGWAGAPGGRSWTLPAIEVEVETPFVSLLATSLDDRPLTESGHILVTALARDRQTGARYSADGSRLEAMGGPPLLLEPVQATLRFEGPAIRSAHRLDIHGVPFGAPIEHTADTITIDGRWASYLFEVRRDVASPAPTATELPREPSPTSSAPRATPTAFSPQEGTRLALPWLLRGSR